MNDDMTVARLNSAARVAISVVIPTLNEAARLEHALASVAWADDVIVVDGGSTDGTAFIARRSGARVIELPAATIGAQRNAGIVVARHAWVLALDADERATPKLRDSVTALAEGRCARHRAYRVRSQNWHLGRELTHGPWGRDWKVRVFSRSERFTGARVHENLESLDDVGILDGTLEHHPYRDLAHQVTKISRYAAWAVDDLRERGRTGSLVALIVRPPWRFVRDYVVYAGWRDGRAGFVLATVSAFSVFLKYALLLFSPEA